ncbi:MAG: DUF1552 domain-containing protein [Steroidobacteraceae bacterium]|jgi:hypothetical protein|nr:DUF1552 domain-containing protein [Steroidobacteraceae bacterium]
MTVLLKRPATRRSVLRGMLGGASVGVALPFLDVFLNESGTALADTGAPIPVRFGTWYWGLGHTPGHAIAPKTKTGPGITFLEECKSLKPYEQHLNYFGGFNMPLDGRSNYTHFTGWVASRTGSAPSSNSDIPAPTLDLLVADQIAGNTRFRTIDCTSVGIPRENYSARSTNNRAAAEASAERLYARVFGGEFADPNKGEFTPDPKVMVRKSVLSAVREDSKALEKKLGAADRARLDEYFTSIRQLENQLDLQLKKPEPNAACTLPERPRKEGDEQHIKAGLEVDTVVENHRIMAKLMAMAVACNQTRIFNMVFSDNFSHLRRPGQTYTHHLLTHEETWDKELGYQPVAFWFNCRQMDAFATFIETFKSIPEGAGTLLDNVLIFAATETNYARVHSIDGVPVFTAGHAGGRIKTGLHVVGNGDPITRVGLTAMQIMGLSLDTWGTRSLQTSKTISEIVA